MKKSGEKREQTF